MSAVPPESREPVSANLPPDIPPQAVPFLQEMGYFEPDCLQVGDRAPLLALTPLGGGRPVILGAPGAARPCVLIFGSYT
ncbi:MAG TPA: hypothetical protein VFB38_16765 [Chthonomonadaceae bacterium]|nr:hypothetical protein [Chthonomonadaceae bacterium]